MPKLRSSSEKKLSQLFKERPQVKTGRLQTEQELSYGAAGRLVPLPSWQVLRIFCMSRVNTHTTEVHTLLLQCRKASETTPSAPTDKPHPDIKTQRYTITCNPTWNLKDHQITHIFKPASRYDHIKSNQSEIITVWENNALNFTYDPTLTILETKRKQMSMHFSISTSNPQDLMCSLCWALKRKFKMLKPHNTLPHLGSMLQRTLRSLTGSVSAALLSAVHCSVGRGEGCVRSCGGSIHCGAVQSGWGVRTGGGGAGFGGGVGLESISPLRVASHTVIADVAALCHVGGRSLSHVHAAVVEREAVIRMESLI